MANEKFLANAPDEVISKVKDKQESLKATLEKITASLDRLSELD